MHKGIPLYKALTESGVRAEAKGDTSKVRGIGNLAIRNG